MQSLPTIMPDAAHIGIRQESPVPRKSFKRARKQPSLAGERAANKFVKGEGPLLDSGGPGRKS
jgi:hypothetical protein